MIYLINQRGQVLVFGLLLVSLFIGAYLAYFSTGRVLATKTRLVHATDAAAYSGALVQARSLNLLAYLNRAQLAHQLAMAHLISLASWAQYGSTQALKLSSANPPAHLIGMLFGANYGLAYLSSAKAAGLNIKNHSDLARAYASHESLIHDDIRNINATLIDNLPDLRLVVIKNVLKANFKDSEYDDLSVHLLSDDWPNPISWFYADNDIFKLIRSIASLHKFLDPRNFTKKSSWSVDARCPSLRHQLRRRGSTKLTAEGQWQASDIQSFHALRSNRWIGCYYREYAMGWAWVRPVGSPSLDGVYVSEPPENFSQQNFWNWIREQNKWSYLDERDNPLANSYAVRDAINWPSRGLSIYPDIAVKDQASISFQIGASLLAKDRNLIHAKSSAHTVFSRPTNRSDKQIELVNLFHPYWHASLINQLKDLK